MLLPGSGDQFPVFDEHNIKRGLRGDCEHAVIYDKSGWHGCYRRVGHWRWAGRDYPARAQRQRDKKVQKEGEFSFHRKYPNAYYCRAQTSFRYKKIKQVMRIPTAIKTGITQAEWILKGIQIRLNRARHIRVK